MDWEISLSDFERLAASLAINKIMNLYQNAFQERSMIMELLQGD